MGMWWQASSHRAGFGPHGGLFQRVLVRRESRKREIDIIQGQILSVSILKGDDVAGKISCCGEYLQQYHSFLPHLFWPCHQLRVSLQEQGLKKGQGCATCEDLQHDSQETVNRECLRRTLTLSLNCHWFLLVRPLRFSIVFFLLYLQWASCLLVKDSNGGFSLVTSDVQVFFN